MKIVDESILFFSMISLSKFSLEALYNMWVEGVFILVCVWNVKGQFFPNRVVWRLGLVIGLSHEFKSQANYLASLGLLSCSEQLARRFSFWHAWHVCFNLAACSREIQSRVSASLHTLEQFFTLSYTYYPYMIPT